MNRSTVIALIAIFGSLYGIHRIQTKRAQRDMDALLETPDSGVEAAAAAPEADPSAPRPGVAYSKELPEPPEADRGNEAIEIAALDEYDGKKKSEILAIRTNAVEKDRSRIPALAGWNYKPNEPLFRAIDDGAPWWGLVGVGWFGPGPKSTDGLSKESRFIPNPYLWIGLEEKGAHVPPSAPADPEPYFPRPSALLISRENAFGRVRYEVTSYFATLGQNGYTGDELTDLALSTYNAQDFGFEALTLVADRSRNVRFATPVDGAVALRQFIHKGNGCGIKDGCNNKSQSGPELLVHIDQLPARATFALYDKMPASAEAPPNGWFVIDLE